MARYNDLKQRNAKLEEQLQHTQWCLSCVDKAFNRIRENHVEAWIDEVVLLAHGMTMGVKHQLEELEE
tara:strand:- start:3719 stop:3922 length:204 start_codon:yes stop_codon:yes gene_type:complete